MQKTQFLGVGGVDKDTDKRLMEPSSVRNAKNLIGGTKTDGKIHVRTNVPGTQEKAQAANTYEDSTVETNFISGVDRIIGSAIDELNKKIYYFVYNSNGFHRICGYDSITDNPLCDSTGKITDAISQFDFNGNGAIDCDSDSIIASWILISEDLNFSQATTIDAIVVNGTYLIWVDGINEPRMINLNQNNTTNFTNEGGYNSSTYDRSSTSFYVSDLYSPLIGSNDYRGEYANKLRNPKGPSLALAKKSPMLKPDVSIGSDTSRDINFLKGRQFQFAYRFSYPGKVYSAWSPWSDLIIDDDEENNPYTTDGDTTRNNVINVSASDVSGIRYGADGVQWMVREGESGKWYLLDDSGDSFSFYGNESMFSMSQSIANQIFNFCPRTAKTVSFINNRVVLGNVKTGYNVPEVKMKANVTYTSSPTGTTSPSIVVTTGTDYTQIRCNSISAAMVGSKVKITVTNGDISAYRNRKAYALGLTITEALTNAYRPSMTKSFTFEAKVKSGDTVETFMERLRNSAHKTFYTENTDNAQGMKGKLSGTAVSYGYNITWDIKNEVKTVMEFGDLVEPTAGQWYFRLNTPDVDWTIKNWVTGATATITENCPEPTIEVETFADDGVIYRTPKGGSHIQLGIVYFDEYGRQTPVLTTEACKVYIKNMNDRSNFCGPAELKLWIEHDPPEWATHYQIYYTPRNDIQKSWMVKISNVTNNAAGEDELSLSYLTTYLTENEGATELAYDFAEGDRVRNIYSGGGGAYFTTPYDLQIKRYDTANDKIVVDSNSLNIGSNDWVEIYRPSRNNSEIIYRATPFVYEIDSNGYHVGGDQTQTTSLAAITTLENFGDTYLRSRAMGGTTILVEDYNMTDSYKTDMVPGGKPNLVDEGYREREYKSQVWYSRKIIQNTNLNGISQFEGNYFFDLDESFGGVYKLYASDEGLEAYMENKVAIIPTGRTLIEDLSGQGLLGTSSVLFGTPKYLPDEAGISRATASFQDYGTMRIFADPVRQKVWLKERSNLIPISDLGMKSHFYEKFGENFDFTNSVDLNPSDFPMLSGFNRSRGEYVISYPIFTEDTVTFSGLSGNYAISLNVSGSDISDIEVGDQIIVSPDSSYKVGTVSAKVGSAITVTFTENMDDQYGDLSFPTTLTVVWVTRETWGFNVAAKQWITEYNYNPEFMTRYLEDLVVFKNGKLYFTEKDTANYNTFFGTAYDSEIEVCANFDPNLKKIFQNIGIQGNSTGAVTFTTEEGQSSTIPEILFEEKEDHFYSEIYRDANTPLVSDPLFNGNPMRSQELTTKIVFNNTDYLEIFRIFVKGALSSNFNFKQ